MVTEANSELSGFVNNKVFDSIAQDNRTLELTIHDFNKMAPQRT